MKHWTEKAERDWVEKSIYINIEEAPSLIPCPNTHCKNLKKLFSWCDESASYFSLFGMRSVISPASKWWIADHHPELVVKSKLGCCSNWPIQIHIDIDLIPRSLDLDSDETRASSTSTVRIAYFRIPPTRACRFASMRSIMMPTTGPTYAARSARRALLETHDDISSLVSNILRFPPRAFS